MAIYGQQELWIGNQGQGKRKRGTCRQKRRWRDDIMQQQHEPELQKKEMNGIYTRRDISYTGCEHSLNDDHDEHIVTPL